MRSGSLHCLLGGLALAVALTAPPVRAQSSIDGAVCAVPSVEPDGATQLNPTLYFPNHGTINALVIFVQNHNDTGRDDCFDSTQPVIDFHQFPVSACQNRDDTPTLQSTTLDPETEWPQGWSTGPARTPPMWASGLLAAPGTPPASFPTGSLSQYYHLNSGGRFALTGYVYPEVYLPANDPEWYQANRGAFENGAVKLSHEILTYVNANRHGIPLGDASLFDRYTNGTNTLVPDGKFDMVIMVFRNNRTCPYGYPQCGGAMTSLGSFAFDASANSFASSPIFFAGASGVGGLSVIDNLVSGSGVWSLGSNVLLAHSITAHEIGHRQYGFNHSTSNILGVMSGSPNRPAMFTAPDRLLLGWATEESVTYGSLAAASNPRMISETFAGDAVLTVRQGAASGDVIVEARTHTNVWDQPAGPSSPLADGDILDFYLQREGLLVYKRGAGTFGANSVENTGFVGRGYPQGAFRGVVRVEYAPGDAYSPLTRVRFNFTQNAVVDAGFAITDIARFGTGFSVSLWRDFLTAPGVKNLGTNYSLANHPAGVHTFPPSLVGMPYDADRNVARTDDVTLGGTVRLTDGLSAVIAGSPTLTIQPNAVVEVPAGVVATLRGPVQPMTTFPVTAGAGASVQVIGRLDATNAAFSAMSAATGWGGLRFGPGSSRETVPPAPSSLTGVSVSGVRYTPGVLTPQYPPHAAVEVRDRTVTLTGGTTVSGSVYANGVLATGKANVTISGSSTSNTGHQGFGILATAGAQVRVTGGASVTGNDLGGILASGFGTRATVVGYAFVDGNQGPGVRSDGQAHTRVRSPAGSGNTSVSSNDGGPTAYSGGSVDGGQCEPFGATGRANRFELNHLGDNNPYDALAQGGSSIVARYAFWGAGRTSLVLNQDGSSTLAVYPLATSVSTPDPSCAVIEEGRTGAAAVASSRWSGAPASASRGGTPSEAVVALATTAREAAWAGDEATAFETLAGASAVVSTDADREAVFEATAALLAETQPAATLAALEATASGGGAEVSWARRALAVARASAGDAAGADALAVELTGEAAGPDGISAHAAFGHGLRVRLAVEADSAAMALDRLAALAAVVTESDTLAVETFGSALALVVAAFPDADMSAVAGGARSAMALPEALLGTTETGGPVDGLAVWPNPAATLSTVRVSVSTPARSAVASVYDALGRRVGVLHDGPLTTGAHDFALAASALAPGVYVVQVRVSPEGGAAAWTEVRRITVTR